MGTLRRNFRDLRDNLIDVHTKQKQHIAATIAKGLAKPHQNDRECARRLRVGSAAWHSAASALKNGHGVFKVSDKPDGSKVLS